MNEPEFLEDARRSGLEILDPLSGQEVTRIMKQLYATAAEIIRDTRKSGSTAKTLGGWK
jgi:hypothetical protein